MGIEVNMHDVFVDPNVYIRDFLFGHINYLISNLIYPVYSHANLSCLVVLEKWSEWKLEKWAKKKLEPTAKRCKRLRRNWNRNDLGK